MSSANESCFVVGVGASAGGLKALEEFFNHMPSDSGAAFVVVQHLSPDFKSLMKELLERRTKMPVKRVQDGMTVEPDTVYLITPRNNLVIKDNTLTLTKQNEHPRLQPNFPIDIFLDSLAEDRGDHAIGVILSGTGSDGTRGLQSISEAGGLSFVQSPASAEFDGMPHSAIATGMIDQVLPPEDIAHTIYDLLKMQKAGVVQQEPFLAELESEKLRSIIQILNQYENLDFSYYKTSTLSRRVYRRCSLSGYVQLEEYIDHLRTSSQERALLRDDLMIGVTRFFRDPDAWAHLSTEVLPSLIAPLENGQQLRIWVTACSTGEEAYSMAIAVDEVIERLGKNLSVKIFATDIDNTALSTASDGIYSDSIAADISQDRLEKYFILRDRHLHISKALRENIIFAPHNLAKNAGFTRMHLISCRNVLIYMQPTLQQHVMRMLHFSLMHKGILFLGAAETPGDLSDEFIPIYERNKIYEKRRNIRLPILNQNLEYLTPNSPKPIASRRSSNNFNPVLATAFTAFAKRRGCTCLLVNDDLELFHVVTDTIKIIHVPEGGITRVIGDLVPEELRLPINTALHRAKREQKPVLYGSINFNPGDDVVRSVNIEVTYYASDARADDFFMLIIDNEERQSANQPLETFQQDAEATQRILDLEYELQQNRENLQATIEELETTNEEQQATNEELLASNEELQSTNEELHSVNEELYTVNTEYQTKIRELTELTNDVDNLLRSSEIGVLFLDRDLRVRKFTPAVTPAVNLVATDVDRPIQHITHNLDCPDLLELLQQVLEQERPLEQEVYLRRSEQNLLMRIYPYLKDDNNVDGLVVTFVNIDEIKQVQKALQLRTDELETIYENSSVGFALFDEDYRFIRINDVMAEINGVPAAEHLQKTVRDVLPDIAPVVEPLFQQVFDTNQPIRHVAVQGTTPAQPNVLRDWIASYDPIDLPNGRMAVSAVVVEVTKLKKTQEALRRSEQQLSDLMRSSQTIIFSCEPQDEFRVTFISDNVEAILGYAPQAFLNTSSFWSEHLHPEDRERVFAGLDTLGELETGEIYSHEYRLRCADGSYRWFLGQLRIARDEVSGTLGNCVGYLVDITSRKRAEQVIEQQIQREQLIKQITDEIRQSVEPQAIFESAVNCIGSTFGVDRCVLRTVSFAAESPSQGRFTLVAEYLGQGIGSVHSLDSAGQSDDLLFAILEEEEAIAVEDVTSHALCADYQNIFQELGIASLLTIRTSYQDQPNGLITLHHCPSGDSSDQSRLRQWTADEIELLETVAAQVGVAIAHAKFLQESEQRQLELSDQNVALAEATTQANAASRAKTVFLANMSHEIRTPMNSILGFSDLLEDLIEDPAGEQYLNAIRSSGETLLRLINDILDVSKVEAGQLSVNYTAIQLRPFIQEIKESFVTRAFEKSLTLEVNIGDNLPQYIFLDEIRLRQILFNLLGNALKFTEQGSVMLQVRAVLNDNTNHQQDSSENQNIDLEFSVRDTGIGINEAEQKSIFNAFQQMDNSIARKHGGAGLGLTITKRLAEMMGGTVAVESTVGTGSTFTVYFSDVATIENRKTLVSRSDQDNLNLDLENISPLTILIVDDVPSNLQLLSAYFNETHHKTLSANNGDTAIKLAQRYNPDVILLDLVMYPFDGNFVLEKLKRDPLAKSIPVILVTASIQEKDIQNLKGLIQGFIRKPVSRAAIATELKKIFPNRVLPDTESSES